MPTNGKIKTASKEVPDGVAVSARVNGKFAPGQSGNPAGRPKVAPEEMALLDRIKSLSGKAVAALESVLDDPDAPAEAKIKASTAVFDRVLGKPRQEIDSNITQNIATPPTTSRTSLTCAGRRCRLRSRHQILPKQAKERSRPCSSTNPSTRLALFHLLTGDIR
jgi:Family of unknown function (DUF5681)